MISRTRRIHLIDLDDRLTVTIERTDVGRSTVCELPRGGKLKGGKVRRAHRIVVQSIRDLIAESSTALPRPKRSDLRNI